MILKKTFMFIHETIGFLAVRMKRLIIKKIGLSLDLGVSDVNNAGCVGDLYLLPVVKNGQQE